MNYKAKKKAWKCVSNACAWEENSNVVGGVNEYIPARNPAMAFGVNYRKKLGFAPSFSFYSAYGKFPSSRSLTEKVQPPSCSSRTSP